MSEDKKLEKRAKKLALAEINMSRAEINRPPLRQITPGWWLSYGAEWIEKARNTP